jgi:hypothetical protein
MEREVRAVQCRDLHKGRVHRGHRLAAILAMMPLWGARHRITALHRLFRRSHGVTIELIYPKQDCDDRDQDWIRKSHSFKTNRLAGLRQGWRFKSFHELTGQCALILGRCDQEHD